MTSNPVIITRRLELVPFSLPLLRALVAGDMPPEAPFDVPEGWAETEEFLLRLRLCQLKQDPAIEPWLVRAIVERGERTMLGHVGFHGPPEKHAVEIGYTVFESYRGQGTAIEAAAGMLSWAAECREVHRFVASAAPSNAASLHILRKLGFRQTGTHWDERDGEELVFEVATDKWRQP